MNEELDCNKQDVDRSDGEGTKEGRQWWEKRRFSLLGKDEWTQLAKGGLL